MVEPIRYINHRGRTFFLHATMTKRGRIRYVMKKTTEGALTELPAEYAITESVNGQVSVEHIRPRQITESEEAMARSELAYVGLNRYRTAVKGPYLTIYEPVRRNDGVDAALARMGSLTGETRNSMSEMMDKGPFDPVMRFCLVDGKKRLFEMERMTYRGEGGWMSLHKRATLMELLCQYVKHLGQASFFDLI